MAEREGYEHGVFNWVDLSTGDVDVAKEFYASLFGWSFSDDSKDGEVVYSSALKNERPVVGLMRQPQDLSEMGVPYMWQTYIKVDDVAAALNRVSEAGGTAMWPIMDVESAGRMAVVADPTVAVVQLWEPMDHFGAHFVNEHATFCWNELLTNDVDTAFTFFSSLFGWERADLREADLTGIRQGDHIVGSIAPTPDGTPSHWAVYFLVDDCETIVNECVGLGGKVVVPAMDRAPGRFAQLADNQDATFWVVASNQ